MAYCRATKPPKERPRMTGRSTPRTLHKLRISAAQVGRFQLSGVPASLRPCPRWSGTITCATSASGARLYRSPVPSMPGPPCSPMRTGFRSSHVTERLRTPILLERVKAQPEISTSPLSRFVSPGAFLRGSSEHLFDHRSPGKLGSRCLSKSSSSTAPASTT